MRDGIALKLVVGPKHDSDFEDLINRLILREERMNRNRKNLSFLIFEFLYTVGHIGHMHNLARPEFVRDRIELSQTFQFYKAAAVKTSTMTEFSQ